MSKSLFILIMLSFLSSYALAVDTPSVQCPNNIVGKWHCVSELGTQDSTDYTFDMKSEAGLQIFNVNQDGFPRDFVLNQGMQRLDDHQQITYEGKCLDSSSLSLNVYNINYKDAITCDISYIYTLLDANHINI